MPRVRRNRGAPESGRAETQAPAVRFKLPGSFRLCLLGEPLQNREERCCLQVRPRILAGLAGASGRGLGVRRPFPP
ncbi:hypothetical protein CapIbe_011862 [Capra ibex]